MTVLGQDTFIRANNASSWGTASDGETYTKTGTGTVSISSNEGVLVSNASDTHMQLGTTTSAPQDVFCRMAINNTADICGIEVRYSSASGTSAYKVLFFSAALHINKAVTGTNTGLVSTSFTMTVNTFYWFRIQVSSTTINAKAWQDGTQEPASWTLTTTDSSISAAGGYALLANTANTSTGVQFDHFVAADAVGTTALTITETATGSEIVTTQITNVSIGTVVETATGSEIVATTSFTLTSLTAVEVATGNEIVAVSAYTFTSLSITETSTGSEIVAVQATTVSPGDASMQLSDLATQYSRILASAAGPSVRILATTYYGNALNNQIIYGELDALLQYEAIGQLHVMRTRNDVSAFLTAYEYATTVLADSPIAYYRLGESGGSNAFDVAGRGFTGLINGGVTLAQAGALAVSTDTSMSFDGTTGYIALPAGLNTANYTGLTLEAWINLSNVTFSNTARILANDNPNSTNLGVMLAVTKNSVIFYVGANSTFASLTHSFTFVASTWYHLVATYNETTANLYINGSLLATGSGASLPVAQTTNTMYISKNPLTLLDGFPGLLDEIAVYNTNLSSGRVLAHYNAATVP